VRACRAVPFLVDGRWYMVTAFVSVSIFVFEFDFASVFVLDCCYQSESEFALVAKTNKSCGSVLQKGSIIIIIFPIDFSTSILLAICNTFLPHCSCQRIFHSYSVHVTPSFRTSLSRYENFREFF